MRVGMSHIARPIFPVPGCHLSPGRGALCAQICSGARRWEPGAERQLCAPFNRGVEDLGEVIEDQPVSFIGDVMECGIRDCVRLVPAIGNEHVSVGIAVPYMHGDRDVFEPKSPGSPFERDAAARPPVLAARWNRTSRGRDERPTGS